ncbi:MAG: retropepsin-like domain-containing protein, partial [Pseudomonadota bacterium]|nr:retropepsin-like domain-containing protein [Pseudomonadota bacterium]
IKYNPFTGTRIYIPATVNGREVEVLLDSGADTTVLDKSFAESVGRQMVGAGVATGSGGEMEAGYAKDIVIEIGDMTLNLPTVAVIDLAEVANRIAIPLPVILGKDVFLQSIVDIDPSGPTIAFHDPKSFTPPPGATLVPLEPLGSLRVVPVSVEGLPEAPMMFDLGNGGYMSLSPAYWQTHKLLAGRKSSTRSSGAIGGEKINSVATLKSIRFAGVTFREVPAELSAPNIETDSDREAGNIGMPLLRRFRMMIDFQNSRIFVIPLADRIDEPFPRDRSGLRAVQDGDKLVISHVSKGSPPKPSAGTRATRSLPLMASASVRASRAAS